ncbi:PREDICTED: tetratricopeptide repeat protein 25 [Haliaeetus leucocephalus]|uniref:tetratricopeptide repeat protein 25 n=1 Tax=Haliaeetus leucocephalus TaxID=52644 RepID=UPI00053CC656|nr:PREDICTED: tetratricopeptide repeat protein 25 [Haliaeetus leucocephalus]
MAEGTLLCRRGEYGKALACFNNALKLRAGDKDCLVARSKCYLKLGDTENSLKDAEASLQNDKTFSKGLYQKAEILYTMGDFEFALVFYHRGYRLRPELQKFRLGIEKSQEAIVNCIGSPSSVKLENKEDLCFISRQAESKKANQKLQVKLTKDQKWTRKREPVRNPKTERQLLGELYADKAYLEKLLRDEDLMESSTKQGIKVADLVLSGISYLDTRSEFWQQQKPIYARVRERKLRQQRWMRDKKQKPAEVGRYIVKSMEDIEMLLTGDCPEESCKKAERVLKTIQGWSDDEVPNKNELIGNLHSCIGNAQLEMGQMEAALQSHKMDLEVARQNDLPDAVSRALDNIGRVYARIGKFQQAIDTWEEKIPMAKSSLEKTWLFHEIGQCYLELDKAEAAQNYGQKSLQSADEEGDVEWQLHATVLVAQAQVKLKDYRSAILNFEKALEKAKLIHNEDAQKAIISALDDVSKSFIEELHGRREETTAYSLKETAFKNTESSSRAQNAETVARNAYRFPREPGTDTRAEVPLAIPTAAPPAPQRCRARAADGGTSPARPPPRGPRRSTAGPGPGGRARVRPAPGARSPPSATGSEGSFSAGSTEDDNLEKGREGEESERSTEHRGGEKQKAAAAAAGTREDHRGPRQEGGEEGGEEDAESKGEERRGARQKKK